MTDNDSFFYEHEIGYVIIPLLLMGKFRLGEVK